MSKAETKGLEQTLTEQYALNIATLGDLGFRDDTIRRQVPSLPEVLGSLSTAETTYLNERRAAGISDALVIAPSVQKIGILGSKKQPGLFPRFNAKQTTGNLYPAGEQVCPYGCLNPFITDLTHKFFDQYDIGDKDAVHDNGIDSDWSIGVLLSDLPNSPYLIGKKPKQWYNLPGLAYTCQTVLEQRELLGQEIAKQAEAGRKLSSANIAQAVTYFAQIRRQRKGQYLWSAGERWGDERPYYGAGVTIFSHYPEKEIWYNNGPYGWVNSLKVPELHNKGSSLGLSHHRIDAKPTWPHGPSDHGVRRVLPIEVK